MEWGGGGQHKESLVGYLDVGYGTGGNNETKSEPWVWNPAHSLEVTIAKHGG